MLLILVSDGVFLSLEQTWVGVEHFNFIARALEVLAVRLRAEGQEGAQVDARHDGRVFDDLAPLEVHVLVRLNEDMLILFNFLELNS